MARPQRTRSATRQPKFDRGGPGPLHCIPAMPATTTTRTPLAQICSAINLPYSPLQPGTEEEVVRRYFLWMLTSLQLQKKALQHQEEPALEAARGLFAQWDSTGIKPPPAVWSEALDRMHGKPQGHFICRRRDENPVLQGGDEVPPEVR